MTEQYVIKEDKWTSLRQFTNYLQCFLTIVKNLILLVKTSLSMRNWKDIVRDAVSDNLFQTNQDFSVVDAIICYTYNLEIYAELQPEGLFQISNKSHQEETLLETTGSPPLI